MSKADVKTKEIQAAAARERFMATLHEVQHRLSPKTIANDVKVTVREKADGALNAAKDGAVQAATHPSTVAAVTIPVLMYLFRKPIAKAINVIFRREPDDEVAIQPYEAARMQTPPAHDDVRPSGARDPRITKPKFTEQGA